jgi:hypothetical protein
LNGDFCHIKCDEWKQKEDVEFEGGGNGRTEKENNGTWGTKQRTTNENSS